MSPGRSNAKKELVAQFKIHAEVEQALKDIIITAVESDYLLKVEDEILDFFNKPHESEAACLTSQTPKLSSWRETKNGTQVRFQCFTSTG